MTLHSSTNLDNYTRSCKALWNAWTGLSVNARRRRMTDTITSLVQSWMPPPRYDWDVIDHWGAFGASDWDMEIQKKWTRKPNIPPAKFVELCITLYHETRHAEQYFRVAQGLATGRIEFPSTSDGTTTKSQLFDQVRHDAMHRAPAGGKVSALVAAFEKGDTLPENREARAKHIQSFLGIPGAVAQRAVRTQASFVGFVNSDGIEECMTRPTWLATVEDWRDSFYRTGGQRVSEFAQEEDDDDELIQDNPWTGQKNRGNVWQMYVGVPEEKDTYGIEGLLRPRIAAAIK